MRIRCILLDHLIIHSLSVHYELERREAFSDGGRDLDILRELVDATEKDSGYWGQKLTFEREKTLYVSVFYLWD